MQSSHEFLDSWVLPLVQKVTLAVLPRPDWGSVYTKQITNTPLLDSIPWISPSGFRPYSGGKFHRLSSKPRGPGPSLSLHRSVLSYYQGLGSNIRDLEPVSDVSFSLEGRSVLSASMDGTAKLWDAESGNEINAFKAGVEGEFLRARFSPDGRSIVTASDQGVVRLWRTNDPSCVMEFAEHEKIVTHNFLSER